MQNVHCKSLVYPRYPKNSLANCQALKTFRLIWHCRISGCLEIADKLFISTTTVDTHRKNLLAKFAVKNTATLIRMAAQYQLI
jgi:hypothetical protein